MIIGTAGHIDHGKTALVRALTGIDGDRLKEEKARGITIDLGFAYQPIAGGRVLGFVDVPGHERFVHTMLAGAGGIDYALLAVAADDGLMPQTLEHLAILDLLGIDRGIVAVTKADLVPAERLEAVGRDIRAALAGTGLAAAEILPVSAVSGLNIAALGDRLAAAAADMVARPAAGGFRLAVDRVFTLAGIGVVVTGTVLAGTVRVGDPVLVSPSGLAARVRSLHAQNRPAAAGRAGDRCALNLAGAGIGKEAIRRGDMVVAPELHAPADRIDATLRVLPGEAKPIGQWFPVRLHHGAAEVGARVVLLGDGPVAPGETAPVQLVLERPIAAAQRDRYVLRDVSAQRTIGGGRFLDLRGPARRRRTPERAALRAALGEASPAAALAALLAVPPFAWDLAAYARDRGLSAAEAARLAELPGLVLLEAGAGRFAVAAERWQAFAATVADQLAAHHADNPDLQGLGREKLRLQLEPRLPAPVFLAAVQRLARDGRLVLDGAFVRLPGHAARMTAADEAAWRAIAPLLGGTERFRPPRVRDIAGSTGRAEREVRRLLKLAGRMGRVDELAQDHFFLRPTVCEMIGILVEEAGRAPGGVVAAAQLRDRLDNGRKVAIQILEFFDRHGVTLRHGDLRRLNKHRLDLFGTPVLSSGADGGDSSLVGRSDFKSEWGSETVPGGFDSHSLPPISSRGAA